MFVKVDFDYPDFDEAFINTPTPDRANQNQLNGTVTQSQLINDLSGQRPQFPRIDRSTKPKPLQSSVSTNLTNQTDVEKLNELKPRVTSLYPDTSSISSRKETGNEVQSLSRELEHEREELNRIRKEKEEEIAKYQLDKERNIKTRREAEQKARDEQARKIAEDKAKKEAEEKARADQARREAEEKLKLIQAAGKYTTKLKDEPTTSKRGLSRSNSSPNIAKMMEEEDKVTPLRPSIDRSSKPAQRESELGSHGEVADDFAVIVKNLWTGQYKCITPRDFKDCLRQFLKEEKMTGSSRWRCPRCKVDRDSVKKIDIWKLPRILLIGLNRFVYEGQWRQKISSFVDFPVQNLNLDSVVKSPTTTKSKYNLYGISSSAAFVLYYTSIDLLPPDFRKNF
ncbi:UBP5 [Mytilus edulis]|uniref:ubiquitinyl hydrolase 1 n=1 Tax=Mytilus edulis TaxID=6550 RepID=A0A8S3VBY6_MYTED|nr:UBP5 [Mytilus edulis]